ncbi:divalent-cation tolerance protein CutA [Ramlibacter sp. XY19]|uniref:divalent-cation tolerance protein CutA n=1 Tax=Ramlibacter paludis TaxID=2908000 RepID=UPI0023DA754D|nr:divalent-cation tolerance protein CutA [Ramlibacter paludis]MCG2591757.1 divalent-cation tolerance protein CutA [Ramlibacter paludis]
MTGSQDRDILVVTTTVATLAQGQALARSLVEARLAACVQVDAVQSVYRWGEKLCDEAEVRLTAKTLTSKSDALQAFFQEHHPYDVPEFLAMTLQASAAYAGWVRNEVS